MVDAQKGIKGLWFANRRNPHSLWYTYSSLPVNCEIPRPHTLSVVRRRSSLSLERYTLAEHYTYIFDRLINATKTISRFARLAILNPKALKGELYPRAGSEILFLLPHLLLL